MNTKTEDAQQAVEQILKPLAERTVPCPECKGTGSVLVDLLAIGSSGNLAPVTAVSSCPRVIPDPRFVALRTGDYVDRLNHFRGIDASAGAILRALQACRIEISLSFIKAFRDLSETWIAGWPFEDEDTGTDHHVYADTAEEALAKALAKAIGTEADGRD